MSLSNVGFTTPITSDIVRGAIELERTAGGGTLIHRLPAWARAQGADSQLTMAEAQPSGVRLAFRTSATVIELVALRSRVVYEGLPPRPDGVIELLIDGVFVSRATTSGGVSNTVNMATGSVENQQGPACTITFSELPADDKMVEIWLPHNEVIELISLHSDAPLDALTSRENPVWLHHGSSISQGSNAVYPTDIWPAVAARAGTVDLINLGFGGSALLDPFTARTLRDTPADLISLKLGINIVNTDVMRLRAFVPAVHGFLDTIREKHADTPLLVVSPIYCPIHENTPGPASFDVDALAKGLVHFVATGRPDEVAQGKLTLGVIRDELERLVRQRQQTDPNLWYLDGRALYGETDSQKHPLPDNLHPDSFIHSLIAERFNALAFGAGAPLDPSQVSEPSS
ncbi:SGNH/GDSL hydrolase family protein [Nocardia sp. 348MFTsu5.1]|uniref:SGNH/GDSL hydrolase family protein n=1 Tax=Nocardia sp. 348MFTsu5.1 TaxID=1172185 RepID=UPI00038291D6|nr:SGNH/GDSL hydrolase family protein [Nocardia sp. 348MFTsu5.1]